MSATASHYDEYEDWGDRHRGRRAAHRRRALRRAHRRAEDRADLYEEVVKFAVVTFLLLIFLRPVGVIVGIVWGLKLFKRYREDEVWPGLRRRWTDAELERSRSRGREATTLEKLEDETPEQAARRLVRHLGEDPRSRENLRYAREAIRGLEELETSVDDRTRAREIRQVRMDELVDRAVGKLRPRLDRARIELRREVDSVGALWGDPVALEGVVGQLVGSAVDALESVDPSTGPRPRLEILMGENLAGSEVWLRVRHNGPALPSDRMQEMVRPFYVPDPEGASSEFHLTLDKRQPSTTA